MKLPQPSWHLVVVVAIAALFASPIASSASSPDAAAQVLNSAIDAASAGNMARALPLFEKAAALAPTDPDVLFNVAYAFTQARRLEEALDLLTRLLRARPNHREAHIKAAQVCRDLGRPSDVVTHLRAALALDPRNPNAYAYLGETLNNLKRWDEAVATYADGLKLIDPSFTAASSPAAAATGSTTRAAGAAGGGGLQPASAMHPQQVALAASTHRSRADALLNLRRPSEALDHLGRALDLQPDDGEALASLWYARLDLNDWACGTKPTATKQTTSGVGGSAASSSPSLSSWTSPSSSSSSSLKDATAGATAPPPLAQWCIDDLGRRAADVAAMGLQQQQQQQQQQRRRPPGEAARPSTLSPYRTLFLPPPYLSSSSSSSSSSFSASSSTSFVAGGGSSGGPGVLSLVASWAQRLAADELAGNAQRSGGAGAASPQQQQQQVKWGSRRERLKRGGSIGGSAGGGSGAVVRVGFVSRRFERYPGTQLMLGLFHHFGHPPPTNNPMAANSTQQQRQRQPTSAASVEFFAYAHGPDDGSSERRAVAAAAAAAASARNATVHRNRIEAIDEVPETSDAVGRAAEAEEADGGDDAKTGTKKKKKKKKKKRRRLSNGRFVDVSALAPSAAAAAVAEDDIDVLFDYDGLHDFNSVALLAHRPAAVAATWLGFAQSPGMGCRTAPSNAQVDTAAAAAASAGACVVVADYLVADRIVVDPAEAAGSGSGGGGGGAPRFSESLLLLPHSYQPQDELQNDVAARFGLAPRTRLQLHRSRRHRDDDNDSDEAEEDNDEAEKETSADGVKGAANDPQEQGLGESKQAVFGRIRAERAERYGLPRVGEGVVLGALVRPAKITPAVFDDFMDILRRTSAHRTVLWLQAGKAGDGKKKTRHDARGANATTSAGTGENDTNTEDATGDEQEDGNENVKNGSVKEGAQDDDDDDDEGGSDGGRRRRLRAEAAARGVDPSRLHFAGGRAPRAAYFERLAAADLFLDTRPYGAHTVAADALWAGCPVLTLPGQPFASRVGRSLYEAAADAEGAAAGAEAADAAEEAASRRKEELEESGVEAAAEQAAEADQGAAAEAPAVPLGAAQSAAAVLVARSSMEFVDTAVRLCGADGSRSSSSSPSPPPPPPPVSSASSSSPSSPSLPVLLEVLRWRVSRGIAPSLSHMRTVASGGGGGGGGSSRGKGGRQRSRAVGLFDSEGFAASLARAAAAMTEVHGAHTAVPGATKKPLPHVYFASPSPSERP